MADDKADVLVVFGSVREERQGIGLARFVKRRIEARGATAALADPVDLPLPLLSKRYAHHAPGTAPEPMARLARMIGEADAVAVVSAEYNHGIPPALKNLLDHYLEEWFFKPAGIVSYSAGRFGGVRAAMQLRMTLAELGMPTISSTLPVPAVADAVTLEGDDRTDWLTPNPDRFLDELMWWTAAARAQKAAAGTPF